MDPQFEPAVAALKYGEVTRLRILLEGEPDLARARSSTGHPTLLQCLVVELVDAPNHDESVRALVEAGADRDAALVAAASVNNTAAMQALLEAGAAADGGGGWCPLEEALYWNHREAADLLLAWGAAIRNLRTAAALGRTDLMAGYFGEDGALKPEAGNIDWPFGDGLDGNRPDAIRAALRANIDAWDRTARGVLNNAFVYACMHSRREAAELLLAHGAEINAIPPGFDYAGTGLHYAALNGHRELAELLLERGADPSVKDAKVGQPPAGWAAYGGHPELAWLLEGKSGA